MLGGSAQLLERLVSLALGEGEPGFGLAKIRRLLRRDGVALLARPLFAPSDKGGELLQRSFRHGNVPSARGANGPRPEGGVIPILAIGGDGQFGGFLPPLQLHSGARLPVLARLAPGGLLRESGNAPRRDDREIFPAVD